MNQKQARKESPWKVVNGVRGLWLYKGPSHPNWPQNVNKPDLHPGWPRILVLDLTAREFDEFDDNPLQFANDHELFPDKPIVWISDCARPPFGPEIPLPGEGSRWTVAILQSSGGIAACAAIPQTVQPPKLAAAIRRQPPWELINGVQGLRLYQAPLHPVWPRDVNKPDLHPDWPRILVLDLTAQQFDEFDDDPLGFANSHNLFPDKPIRWMSNCAKAPLGGTIPMARRGSRCTALILHKLRSTATCAAIAQSLEVRRRSPGAPKTRVSRAAKRTPQRKIQR